MDLGQYNINDLKINELVPAGEYDLIIASAQEKDNKAGTGSYLDLGFQIIDGEHKGRMFFEKLNLNNPTPKAVHIAKETLKKLCLAMGIQPPNDEDGLLDIPFKAGVAVKKGNDGFDDSNYIKKYIFGKMTTESMGIPMPATSIDAKPWE